MICGVRLMTRCVAQQLDPGTRETEMSPHFLLAGKGEPEHKEKHEKN